MKKTLINFIAKKEKTNFLQFLDFVLMHKQHIYFALSADTFIKLKYKSLPTKHPDFLLSKSIFKKIASVNNRLAFKNDEMIVYSHNSVLKYKNDCDLNKQFNKDVAFSLTQNFKQLFCKKFELNQNDVTKIIAAKNFISADSLRSDFSFIQINSHIASTNAYIACFIKAENKNPTFYVNQFTAQFLKLFYQGQNLIFSNNKNELSKITDCNTFEVIQLKRPEKYPEINKIWPTESKISFTINTKYFTSALNFIKPHLSQSEQVVLTIPENDNINEAYLSFNNNYEVSGNILLTNFLCINLTSMPFQIGFNCSKLLAILKTINTPHVNFSFTQPNHAIVINNAYLLMPVLITEPENFSLQTLKTNDYAMV